MHAALKLPEIQTKFIRFLAPADAVALARTSHAFFHSATRQAWGTTNVPIQCLLALLGRVTIGENRGIRMLLPDDFSEAHLGRFDLYAPYVTCLVSNLARNATWESKNCELLISIARSRILLPSLSCLKVRGEAAAYQSGAFAELLAQFIQPSLRVMRLDCAYLPSEYTNSVRKALSVCSRLEFLSLASLYNAPHQIESLYLALPEFPILLCIERLNITSKDITPGVLSWLAGLPRLKRLLIEYRYPTLVWEPLSLTLPPNSFATLKSLTVTFDSIVNAETIWSSPLVNNLTSVRVMFHFWQPCDPLEIARFFRIMARNSPNLTTFSMVALYEHVPAYFTRLPVETFSPLSSLSLSSFQLGKIQLRPNNGDSFEHIAQWWPSLRALDLRYQMITFDDLAVISRSFPWLDFLHLKLTPILPPGKDVTLPPVQHFSPHLTFQTPLWHIYSLSQPQQHNFALYLARLWKNVTCIHPCRLKDYKRFVAGLNARISEYSKSDLAKP
ncbi:hypothetical protein BDV93DRAFT_548772 [Ceratobasidium sp. AG-I]|nr:hypothetical protein BDV93DRAFT_548772 [Ceratobasidium sp. AG-I]